MEQYLFLKCKCHREKTNTAERTNVPLNILIVKLPPEFMVKFYNISICSKQMFISNLSMYSSDVVLVKKDSSPD